MSAWVYILTNTHHTTLYIGVTSNLIRRMEQHHTATGNSFTHRYNLHKLVYVEEHTEILIAIAREKALKGGSRQRKLDLIASLNPTWQDLLKIP